jgi:dTDP-4-amino-4,6-dideoxygalactose transaminase
VKNFWLSPNTQRGDAILALKALGREIADRKESKSLFLARKKLADFLRVSPEQIFLFNSARSALFLLLKTLEIGKGDLVAVQAYTCRATVDPLLKLGATPWYVDIDESWNIDPEKLEEVLEKHGRKVKAVVTQHTFGVAADIEKIKDICRRHNIILIEDCAHALGGRYKNTLLGGWGDFSFFSFGRDKVVSCVFGGALLVNNLKYLPRIEKEYKSLREPSRWWIVQQLSHPILMESLIIPLYDFCSIGKIILYLSQKLGLLSKASFVPMPAKMPESLGVLLLNQIKKLEDFNDHRRKLAELYASLINPRSYFTKRARRLVGIQKVRTESLPVFLRFGIKVKGAEWILKDLRKRGVYLDRWLGQAVGPAGVSLEKVGYQIGSCPRAEELAKSELQFPTGIKVKVKQARKLVKLFWRSYGKFNKS